MKLYNYWIRSYRSYIILQFLEFIFVSLFIGLELMMVEDLGKEIRNIETEFRDVIVDGVLSVVVGVTIIYTIIKTVMLVLDLIEGPQSRNMKVVDIDRDWRRTELSDPDWCWEPIKFQYSLSYEERKTKDKKNKKQIRYMKLHGNMSEEKVKKILRMGSPRFEVVYYRRSKIMIELK